MADDIRPILTERTYSAPQPMADDVNVFCSILSFLTERPGGLCEALNRKPSNEVDRAPLTRVLEEYYGSKGYDEALRIYGEIQDSKYAPDEPA